MALSRLFAGADIKLKEKDIKVRLRPMRVVQTKEMFSASTPESIRLVHEAKTVNWIKDGLIVLNGDNGKGIDIFYTLELAGDSRSKYVLVTDQRKRVHGTLDVKASIEKARILPGAVQRREGIEQSVVALFSMFTCATQALPMNSIAVTFREHKGFHGSLHQHPAASFCVHVNVDGVTALCGLFQKLPDPGVSAIARERKKADIKSFDQLKTLLGENADNLWDDAEHLCNFAR